MQCNGAGNDLCTVYPFTNNREILVYNAVSVSNDQKVHRNSLEPGQRNVSETAHKMTFSVMVGRVRVCHNIQQSMEKHQLVCEERERLTDRTPPACCNTPS